MARTSQAAMEFLTTYGWALLVLLLGIGALTYWGLPQRSDSVDFGVGFHVVAYDVSLFDMHGIATITLYVQNLQGSMLRNVTLHIAECNNWDGKSSLPKDIPEGAIARLRVTCEGYPAIDVIESSLALRYSTVVYGELLRHERRGILRVTTKDMTVFSDTNMGRRAWALYHGGSGESTPNRFVPCADVPGCTNPDDAGILKQVFGGYVDSVTGMVWSDRAPDTYQWSIRNNSWDIIQPEWDYVSHIYHYTGDVNLALRDDTLGSAFTYCTSLSQGGFTDWKLPSPQNFIGFLDCAQCLPPYGTYPPPGGIGGIFYWTDHIAAEQTGFSVCIPLIEDSPLGMTADCNRDQFRPIRCIRDTP